MTLARHKIAAARDGWLPRLVVTDLDGTLVSHHHGMSDEHRDMMEYLIHKGIPVVPATGRGPRLLDLTRAEVGGGDGYLIMAQGAVVFGGRTLLHADSMPYDDALTITDKVRGALGEVRIGAEDAHDFGRPLRLQHGFQWPYSLDEADYVDSSDVLVGDVLKIFVETGLQDIDDLLQTVRAVIPPDTASVTHSGIGFVEISPVGVTKATGIAFVADRLGIDAADVLCFGDMPNDIPMFEWAGRSVAMANAHPDVLAVADDVTGTCEELGFSTYIKELFNW